MKVLSLLVFLIPLYSCVKTSSNESDQFKVLELNTNNTSVTFDQLKTNILEPHCLRCHGEWSSEAGLNEIIETKNLESSLLLTSVLDGSMPKNSARLNNSQIDYIRNYLKGLRNRIEQATPPVPVPAPVPELLPTYQSLKHHLLKESSCLKCHSGPNAEGKFRVDSEEYFIQNIEAIYESIDFEEMPPVEDGYDLVSEEVKAILEEYMSDLNEN